MEKLPMKEQVIEALERCEYGRVRSMTTVLQRVRDDFLAAALWANADFGVNVMAQGIETMKEFVAAGIDVNVCDEGTGRTALHIAMEQGSREAVDLLVAGGANPGRADFGGRTPMDAARDDAMKKVLKRAIRKRARQCLGKRSRMGVQGFMPAPPK